MPLHEKCKTKVISMGNITELLTIQNPSDGIPIRKIDKDHYCDIRSGELFEYNHIESRADSTDSIRRTLSHIRALINTNATDPNNVRWITFTYAENMTDTKRLYKDYFKFWKRFLYWCTKKGIPKPEYITIQEPQGRGAWHIHAFFIWSDKAPFIPNNEMAELWGQGYTTTKAMNDVDNAGAYFSAYLGDMPLDEVDKLPTEEKKRAIETSSSVEEKQFIDEQGNIKTKKFVKGARLIMYPPGMNIIRKTKGIKEPIIEYMDRKSAEKKVSAATETFSRVYEILNDDGEVINRISKTYYNSKRKHNTSKK